MTQDEIEQQLRMIVEQTLEKRLGPDYDVAEVVFTDSPEELIKARREGKIALRPSVVFAAFEEGQSP